MLAVIWFLDEDLRRLQKQLPGDAEQQQPARIPVSAPGTTAGTPVASMTLSNPSGATYRTASKPGPDVEGTSGLGRAPR
jgi:hypothetical protein